MPPPPPEEPEPPKPLSEAEELQLNIGRVTDESLSSTRRMKMLCEEAKEAGIKTLVALDDQGEQLDNIEKGLRDINEDMVEAEQALQGMNACCWGLCVPCTKKAPESAAFKLNEDGKKGGGNAPPPRLTDEGVPTYGGFIAKYTNDAAEDEMENNMEEVSNMIGNLRNMAVDMGSEINNQNSQLDRINYMAEENSSRIAAANEQATKLLK